ncbi:MAG: CHASE domain-containing protein [Pyrinomonadaceae bacterium]
MGKSIKNGSAQADLLKLPYLVLIVSTLLTIGATYIFYQSEQSKDSVRFQGEVERGKNRLEGKIKSYIGLLKAGRGFIESNAHLDKKSFANFVASLEVEKNYPEVQEIGFSQKINLNERETFLKKMRAGGYPDFKIFPSAEKNEYQPVVYIEPDNEQNRMTIGFNLLSEPAYQAAMKEAGETGEPASTDEIYPSQSNLPFYLTQSNSPQTAESEKRKRFLIFMPVYKGRENLSKPDDGQKFLEGFIYDSIDADAFLQDALKTAAISDVAVKIYGSEIQPDKIIAQTENNSPPDKNNLSATTEIKVANKNWIVKYQTLPSFGAQSGINWAPIILTIGVIFSLVVFGMTYLESSARAKAENFAGELQESEREKGFLLEREQKARRATEESSRAKDDFISIVSHELRTPLNSIAGWSRILKSENLNENVKKKALQTIDKNVREQTKIVEDLLDLSQILSSKQDLIKREVDLSKLFDEIYADMEIMASEKKVSLFKNNSLNGQKIRGDEEKLRKVLKNLFSNAIKFTPENGKIFAELRKNKRKVEIEIRDTGQGINPDFIPRVFENFRQADSSTTRAHGGLGLGLAITRRIVELHGGRISASSEGEGKGTVFTIELPASS